MGLRPLEFTDCLTDSPYFRDSLNQHEKELDRTSQAVKGIIRDIKEILAAAKNLSRAQRNLANTFQNLSFDCIGNSQTDDELVIGGSLNEFGRLLSSIEDERDRIIESSSECFISPLENFRKEHIGAAKEEKKRFEKETVKFCQSLERHLNMSTKKTENQMQEADASLEMEQRHFITSSLDYVLRLQEVHESKKFEFVERILLFMSRWLTFYHQGYEVCTEFKSFMRDLQIRLQRTRVNCHSTSNEAAQLKDRMLSKLQDPGSLNKMYTRQGYLFLMEKKALGTTWTKHFCQYQKDNKRFAMIGYNQTAGKIVSSETVTVSKCLLRNPDSIDKRFCFDIIISGKQSLLTFQALSEKDYKLWLDAMDGKEPNYVQPGRAIKQDYMLDEAGFTFVHQCIEAIESRGLQDQGLYRLVGVNSKVNKLINMTLDQVKKSDKINLVDSEEWETKTITSALKTYFRNLPEPLMTFKLHGGFVAAAKQENRAKRIVDIHSLVQLLPNVHRRMLEILSKHLWKVSQHADKNLMTVSNLGVCFGPTLLRPEEETMAAVMDIKFCNVTIEVVIDNHEIIFGTSSPTSPVTPPSDLKVTPISGGSVNLRPEPGRSPREPNRLPSNQFHSNSSNQRISSKFWMDTRGVPYQGALGSPLVHPALNSPPSPQQGIKYTSVYNNVSPINLSSGLQSPVVRVTRQLPAYVTNPLWDLTREDSSLSHSNPTSQNGTPDTSPSQPGNRNQNSYVLKQTQNAQHHTNTIHHSGNKNFPPMSNNTVSGGHVSLLADSAPSTFQTHHSKPSGGRKVRTLFACMGENELELTFNANEIIYDVRASQESGWLEGCLNGRVGLVPQNYVEFIT